MEQQELFFVQCAPGTRRKSNLSFSVGLAPKFDDALTTIIAAETRWDGEYDNIERCMELKPALLAAFTKLGPVDRDRTCGDEPDSDSESDTSSDDDDDDDDDEVANVNFGDYSGVKGTGAGPKGGKKKSKKKGLKCTQYEEKMIVNILGKPVWEVHEAHSAHKTLKEVHKRLGGDDKPFQPTPKTFKRPPDPPDGAGDGVGVVPPGPTQAETFSETEPPPTDAPPQPQPEAPPQDEAVPPESAEDDFM